jgi:hypothetical protein
MIIDTVADPGAAKIMQDHGSMPPPNAVPLDQQTFDLMASKYPKWSIITMPGQDGINRKDPIGGVFLPQ